MRDASHPTINENSDVTADIQALLAQQLRDQAALPPLREDLTLHTGATQKDGAPSWVIEDPMRGRFFRIGWLEFEVLNRWHLGDARQVAEAVKQATLLSPSVEEVLAIKQFFCTMNCWSTNNDSNKPFKDNRKNPVWPTGLCTII